MIMGRKTFDSFPAPLPGRRHIVLTREPGWRAAGTDTAAEVDTAIALAGEVPAISVIGGAEILALSLPLSTRIELTSSAARRRGAECVSECRCPGSTHH